jgi:hypothetical protein
MPALALASNELHVGAAYLLFVALVVVYVVIIRARFARASNQIKVLEGLVAEEDGRSRPG